MCFIQWGYSVDETLRHEPEDSGYDIRRGNGEFVIYLIFPPAARCVGLTTLSTCRLSRNSGSLTLFEPQGLSKSVMG